MRKAIWRVLQLTLLTCVLTLAASGASAAASATLRAGCPSAGDETVISRKGSRGTVLSLPGYWDASAVTLEAEGSETLYIGRERKEIRAGVETDLTEYVGQGTIPLYNEKGWELA